MLFYWLPVAVWLGVIFAESMSRYAADDQTSRIIVPLLHWMMPRLNAAQLSDVHHLLRKAGHFTGYGFLTYLFFRAFRASYQTWAATAEQVTRVCRRSTAFVASDHWRPRWALLAVLGTAMVATADELHQMTLPYRGGSWRDVLLDCVGGLTFMAILFLYWRWRCQAPAVPAALSTKKTAATQD